MKWLIIVLLLWGTDEYHRVALDEAERPHLLSGSEYRYADAPEGVNAVVAFGQQVVFGYDGLDPKAAYRMRITFVSDGPRVQNLFAGETLLAEKLKLDRYAPYATALEIPAKAYAEGRLIVRIERVEGPNAVVSSIEILSTNPEPLAPLPEPEAPDYAMPRLTPAPDRVFLVMEPRLDLTGTWRFHPDPPARFHEAREGWEKIEVPGQWAQQGFEVDEGKAAAYLRSFHLPADWEGKRIKLRCDGVYSDARVYVNRKEAGRHLGGFTPFELDVTDLVRPGSNTLALLVKARSLADTLASGIQYAAHDLGGIPRKLYLMALPEVHVAGFHVETWFDAEYTDATIKARLEIANEGKEDTGSFELFLRLNEWPGGPTQSMEGSALSMETPLPGTTVIHEIEIPIKAPRKWHAETPNLYFLIAELSYAGEVQERVMRRFGFRQVEVQGDELLVNGRPVKLRGTCRHEVHPLRGRSLRPEDWHRDAQLFREANCNYIRTSHYPPAEEFLDACDELGLFVEEEAPLCWVGHGANQAWKSLDPHDDQYFPYIQQCILEMIQRDRSHPSVIVWSLANESAWGTNWRFADANAASADPTRPRSFHDQCYGGYNNHGSTQMPVANFHYPGPKGAQRAAEIERPLLFGEYCHLNAYNRHELITDPGLRDAWGRGFQRMWETVQSTEGMLGGAIWSGIDDSFFLSGNRVVGYGTWGPIDGWRRKKPEFWHVKKTYSPVKLHLERGVEEDGTLKIPVENRHDVTNLKDLKISWTGLTRSGNCIADVPARSRGLLEIPSDGEYLRIEIKSPRGFIIDEYLKGGDLLDEEPSRKDYPRIRVSRHPVFAVGRKSVLLELPELMVLPLNAEGGTQMTGENKSFAPFTSTCTEWKPAVSKLETETFRSIFRVEGRYAEAEGKYSLFLAKTGKVELDYRFTCLKEVNPRQIGMVFTLPRSFATLSWSRKGQWTVYSADHIGRLKGKAPAFPNEERCGPAGPASLPAQPWSRDTTALGSNDFRSTKENIHWASLTDADGEGLRVVSEGKHHVRAWVEGDSVRLLVAYYNNPGAERFFRSHAALEDRPLKPGDVIEDTITLEWCTR